MLVVYGAIIWCSKIYKYIQRQSKNTLCVVWKDIFKSILWDIFPSKNAVGWCSHY